MKTALCSSHGRLPIALLTIALMALLPRAHAALSYSAAGTVYSENFDSLPISPENVSLQSTIPWADDSTSSATQTSLPGWYLYHPAVQGEGGANGHQRLRIGAGTSTTGAFWSFGAAGSSDRALGDLGSATMAADDQAGTDGGNLYIALRLRNETGQTLESFTLSYTGEQWHGGTGGTAETMTFGWSTTATSVNDPSTLFTTVPDLGWTSPVILGAEGAVDGNVNRVVMGPVTVSGLVWAPGTDLWLRWTDPQAPGVRDDGMALDDLCFFAVVPEPGGAALFVLGALMLGCARRMKIF